MRTIRPGVTTRADAGLRELTRQIAMATRYRISESTSAKLRDEVRAQIQVTAHDTDDMN